MRGSEVTDAEAKNRRLFFGPTSIFFISDEEPPILLACPAYVTKMTNSQTLKVSWNSPRFQDNVDISSLETNSQVDGILASLDAQTEVWYQAKDEAGQHAHCNFTVSLKGEVIQTGF